MFLASTNIKQNQNHQPNKGFYHTHHLLDDKEIRSHEICFNHIILLYLADLIFPSVADKCRIPQPMDTRPSVGPRADRSLGTIGQPDRWDINWSIAPTLSREIIKIAKCLNPNH